MCESYLVIVDEGYLLVLDFFSFFCARAKEKLAFKAVLISILSIVLMRFKSRYMN